MARATFSRSLEHFNNVNNVFSSITLPSPLAISPPHTKQTPQPTLHHGPQSRLQINPARDPAILAALHMHRRPHFHPPYATLHITPHRRRIEVLGGLDVETWDDYEWDWKYQPWAEMRKDGEGLGVKEVDWGGIGD
jgi:hypothetical protein